jgi:hypothetical protein
MNLADDILSESLISGMYLCMHQHKLQGRSSFRPQTQSQSRDARLCSKTEVVLANEKFPSKGESDAREGVWRNLSFGSMHSKHVHIMYI